MQLSRMFEILYILLNKRTVTARELAERFEVSQRTIYRDVDALALAGIPVYTCKGKGGGIRLVEDFVLNKSLLSDKEQEEILSALHGLAAVRTEDAAGVLDKLSTLFNRSMASWLEVDFSDWSYSNGDRFLLLKTAILEKRIVEFDYYSSGGVKTHRRMEPLQLWFKHRAWYVKGYCLTRQDLRMFKLTRMKEISLTGEAFEQRNLLAECEADAGEPAAAEETRGRRDVTLKLKIAPEMTYRVYDEFDEDIITVHGDGSFTVTVSWPEDEWVYGFVLSFGEYIEVLEPERIRAIIREKAEKTAGKYL